MFRTTFHPHAFDMTEVWFEQIWYREIPPLSPLRIAFTSPVLRRHFSMSRSRSAESLVT